MMPITTAHDATTFKLRCFCKSVICPFIWFVRSPACIHSFLVYVAVIVDHRTRVPMLHGANFSDRNAHVLVARLFERQSQRKRLSHLQRVLQSKQHDVHTSWIEAPAEGGTIVSVDFD